jgi:uncharacterized protein (TIGR03790 family)
MNPGIRHRAAAVWFLLAALVLRAAPNEGAEVLVIFNSRSPESKAVAEHYARKRSVPPEQVTGFDLPVGGSITRKDYTELLQNPLKSWMESKRLATWTNEPVPASGNFPAGVKYTLTESRIRYLLLCYDIPWYILNDATLREDTNGIPDVVRRNDACLDQEICLLPRLGHYKFTGLTTNPFSSITNASFIHPRNGAFAISRLDGPTPAIAMGLVDKALEAEARGLWGHAYIDLRGITSGAYSSGDVIITNAATGAKRLGFETFVDNLPETFRVGYPMSQIGLYVGWYDAKVTGPFTRPEMEFLPGAFGYHLHSFSGANLRSRTDHWVGPMLDRGVTSTMGCVAEPYLSFTPHPGVFLERWGYLGMTFAEAAMTSHPVLSWQTVVVGDPLYRPFRLNPLQYGEMLAMANSPLTAYAMVRKVNIDLLLGRLPDPRNPFPSATSPELVATQVAEAQREFLEGQPMAKVNAVLAEKIARLYWSRSWATKAAEWYALALAAPDCTPRQRVRLHYNSVEAFRILDRPRSAYDALEEVMKADPDRSDALNLRTRQLQFAREMRDKPRTDQALVEVQRLTPTNAPPK